MLKKSSIGKLRALGLTTVVVACSMLFAGCSGAGTTGSPSKGSGQSTPATLKVGITPIADAGGFYVAQEKGFFKDNNIKAEKQTINGGAALIPALESGALDIGFSNLVSVLQAREKGLDVKCLAGALKKGAKGEGLALVLAPKDKGIITDAKDLNGKTIAINSVKNINQIVAESWIDANGGDSSSVKFVAVAFPDMPAALTGGRVDAAIAPEPFVTIAKGSGATVLDPRPYQAIAKTPVFSCWLVTGEWVDSHKQVAKEFISAMKDATKYLDKNPEYLRSILPKYTSISKELAAKITLPKITTDLTPADYNVWQEAALKYGLIKKKVDPAELDAGLNK